MQHASRKPEPAPGAPSRQVAKVGVELEGLRASFIAEAVFAALQVAADVAALQAVPGLPCEDAPSGVPSEAQSPASQVEKGRGQGETMAAIRWREAVTVATGKAPRLHTHSSPVSPSRKSPRKAKLDLRVDACLQDLQADMWLSDSVAWRVEIGSVAASYAARCAVIEHVALLLNDAPLIRLGAAVAAVQLPGILEEAAAKDSPWVTLSKAEDAASLGRALVGGPLVEAAHVVQAAEEQIGIELGSQMGSIITDATLDEDGRTLSRQDTSASARWREIVEMGSASEAGDASPAPSEKAAAPRPLPQRPFGVGLERLAAAYRRAGLHGWVEGCAATGDAHVRFSL
jgi:hypothetical protein